MTTKKLTPIKAIRAKCLDCSNGQVSEVRNCIIPRCPLHIYRMGHRPKSTSSQPQGELAGKSATSKGVFAALEHDIEVSA